jgi:mono/diheme cytochrome c family protein
MSEHTTPTPVTPREPQLVGTLAQFAGPHELVEAGRAIRERGYRKVEAYSPFPIHGIDDALGTKPTPLPWVVLAAGITGCILAVAMQWYMNAYEEPHPFSGYKYAISAKPYWSLPANIPVTFELVILFSAFTAFFAMIAFNGLPKFANPLFLNPQFRKATDDGFFLYLDAADPLYADVAVRDAFQSTGATYVEPVYEQPATPMPGFFRPIIGVLALVALLPLAYVMMSRGGTSEIPRLSIWWDMDYQPKFGAQTLVEQAERDPFPGPTDVDEEEELPPFNPLAFPYGRASRLPVAGTVARGQLRLDPRLLTGIEPQGEPTEPVALLLGAQTEQPPAGEEPAEDQPGSEEPGSDDPPGDEPAEDQPADDPPSDQPATEEPESDEPAADEPATEEPATEEMTDDQPDVEEQPADDTPPVGDEQPDSDQPADEEPGDQPPGDEPPADETADPAAADGEAPAAGATPAAPVDNTPWVKTFPKEINVNRELLDRGRQRFNIYCAACHGRAGEGDGLVSVRAMQLQKGTWTQAANLHAEAIRDQPVGKIYNTITFGSAKGTGKMPGYAEQIPLEDRWAITLYVKALQRSRTSSPDDLPEDLRPAP